MRRTRSVLAAFSLATTAAVLGIPAAHAASLPTTHGQVSIVAGDTSRDCNGDHGKGDGKSDNGNRDCRCDRTDRDGTNGRDRDCRCDRDRDGRDGNRSAWDRDCRPRGGVPTGEGGSVTGVNTTEIGAGAALAALGLGGAAIAWRRRTPAMHS